MRISTIDLKNRNILITGGTGSFGRCLTKRLLGSKDGPRRIIIFSRDELKQYEMASSSPFSEDSRLRFFLGDVRDRDRLSRAFDGVDYVVHAAAQKQVPASEYNPFEAIKTNILGAQNVIDCAIDKGVSKVIALSSDKAANPVNLYGATKLCSDKLFIAGNMYAGARDTSFSVVRYGNVVGSRGSVIPLFLRLRNEPVLPITDPRMTRFWIPLQAGVEFVLDCLDRAHGAEVFVPKLPSMTILDIAKHIAAEAEYRTIGIRPGEKLHEVLVPEDDARTTIELEDRFVVLPPFSWQRKGRWGDEGTPCPDGFVYSSNTNEQWLSTEELTMLIASLDLPEAKQWVQERNAG